MVSDSKLVHVRVYVSGTLPAKVQQVWDTVRNYGQAENWLTGAQGVKTFTRLLPGQINNQIGSVRLVTIGQASFVDQLDALDDDRHVMKFKLISHPLNTNPFPGAFLNYRAVIKLYEVTRGASTFMEWTGEFDTEPQDCQAMRQAILERLEAGFEGLENLFPPSRPLQHSTSMRSAQVPRPVGGDAVELQRGMNSMNLRATSSVPLNPASRSPRAGPASVASEVAVPTHARGITESGSGSSLASSPHLHEMPGQRPGSGHTVHQWTSGGSGSTIHLSTLPLRLSAEDGQLLGHDAKRLTARRSLREGVPEGSPFLDQSTLPQAFHAQVKERQGVQPGAAFEAFQKFQQDMPRQRISREQPPAESQQPGGLPPTLYARQMDPLLREREDFKAAILAQRFQHMLPKHVPDVGMPSVPGPTSKSEPDWSRATLLKEDDVAMRSAASSQVMTPFASTGIPGTDDDAEWARLMQQREDDLREAQSRRSRSPASNRATLYGQPGLGVGPGAAPLPLGPHFTGGPFAAASAMAGVHRSVSHSSLSQQASGALDRSMGSAFSHPDEGPGGVPRQPQDMNAWSSA